MESNLVILFFEVLVVVFLLLKTFMIIPERQAWVIQRLGKYNRICGAGFNVKIPFIDSISGHVNLRVRELPVEVETKTKDDVFVKIGSKKFSDFSKKK